MSTEAQQEQEYPSAWKPTAGDKIKGTVEEISLIDPNGRGGYPCVTVRTENGETAIHAFHTVLRRELARRAPKVGDELEVAYLGKRPGGRGDEYHAYRVAGSRAGGEFDWSQELPEDERPERVAPEIPIEPAPLPTQPAPKSVVDDSDDLPF